MVEFFIFLLDILYRRDRLRYMSNTNRKLSTKARLFAHIKKYDGVTSIGIASVSLDVTCETVRKHFKSLCAEGLCCFGWDGQALSLTIPAR